MHRLKGSGITFFENRGTLIMGCVEENVFFDDTLIVSEFLMYLFS